MNPCCKPRIRRGNINDIMTSTSSTSQPKFVQTSSTSSTSILTLNFLTETRYLNKHSLNDANSALLFKPNYKYGESNDDETDSSEDDDLEKFPHGLDDNTSDDDYSADDDDIMIDDPSSDEDCLYDATWSPTYNQSPDIQYIHGLSTL